MDPYEALGRIASHRPRRPASNPVAHFQAHRNGLATAPIVAPRPRALPCSRVTVVLGIDPSLTSTGLARITITPQPAQQFDDVEVRTVCVGEAGHRKDLPRDRRARVQRARRQILRAAVGADLVVIETPFYNRQSTQAAIMDRSWLWGTVVDGLHAAGTPVVHVAAKQRAKFATDNGNSGKTAVAEAIHRVWADHLDDRLRNDDEYDALALATPGVVKACGRHRLPIRILEHHLHVIAGLDWHEWENQP